MTVGVCGSYLVFIGSQVSDLINVKWLTQTVATAIIAVPMIFLALARSYSFLVPFNILGINIPTKKYIPNHKLYTLYTIKTKTYIIQV